MSLTTLLTIVLFLSTSVIVTSGQDRFQKGLLVGYLLGHHQKIQAHFFSQLRTHLGG